MDREVEVFLAQNTASQKRFAPDFRSNDMFEGIVDEKAAAERMNTLRTTNGHQKYFSCFEN